MDSDPDPDTRVIKSTDIIIKYDGVHVAVFIVDLPLPGCIFKKGYTFYQVKTIHYTNYTSREFISEF